MFTDEENVVDKVNCTAPLGKSDHMCIEFNYLTGVDVEHEYEGKRNYWRADYAAIRNDLHSVNWERAFENKDVAGMLETF